MPTFLGMVRESPASDTRVEKKNRIPYLRRTASRTFAILGDNYATDTEEIILSTVGLPPLYYYDSSVLCFAVKYAVKERQIVTHPSTGVDVGLFDIEVSYDSDLDLEQAEETDPTAKRPIINWSSEIEEEVLEVDAITGDPIVTEPGEVIVVMTPMPIPILTIQRYEAFPFDPSVILDYACTVNESPFYGAPSGSALMMPMEVGEETIETTRYAVVTYTIKFKLRKDAAGNLKEDTWKANPLHHGTKYRPAAMDPPKTAEDDNGNPTTVNLDTDGTRLDDGDPPVYLSFNRFPKSDFSDLNL